MPVGSHFSGQSDSFLTYHALLSDSKSRNLDPWVLVKWGK